MRTESFLENSPAKLLQSFFDRLPDHQIDRERGSTHPTDLGMEVSHFSRVLQTHLGDITSNPTLMINFNCGVEDVPTINLTKDEEEVRVTLLRTPKMTWRCPLQCLIPQLTNELPMVSHPRLQLLLQTSNSSPLSPLGDWRLLCQKRTGLKPSLRLEQRRLPLTLMHMPPRMRPA